MAKPEQELGNIRDEIDALDVQLFELLRKRATLAGRAGEIKRKRNDKEFAKLEREAEVLGNAAKGGGDVIPASSMRAIYREIISACLAMEKTQNVCYLGPEYTFTHEAAQKHFGHAAEYTSAATVREAVSKTEKEDSSFTVVPFENSNGGTVGETFDVLADTDLQICGEVILRIRHNLLARHKLELNSIETIYAHPQTFEQCRDWLQNHMPKAKLVALASNSAAAAKIAPKPNDIGVIYAASIASLSAAKHYNLKTVKEGIEDSAFNTTRFLMLGRISPPPSGNDKTSLIMAAHHESGALYKLLEPFSRLGINMSKFESRPARGKLGEYLFFVDIDGHREDKEVSEALDEIYNRASLLKVLGSYPKGVA